MADSRIHMKAEVISQALDDGNAQRATRLLQEELNSMPPAEALSLVKAIERRERQGIGADLNLEHIEKPGQDLTKVNISQRMSDQLGHLLYLKNEVGVIHNPLRAYSSQSYQQIQHNHNHNRHYNDRGPLGHLLHGVLRHELREN